MSVYTNAEEASLLLYVPCCSYSAKGNERHTVNS